MKRLILLFSLVALVISCSEKEKIEIAKKNNLKEIAENFNVNYSKGKTKISKFNKDIIISHHSTDTSFSFLIQNTQNKNIGQVSINGSELIYSKSSILVRSITDNIYYSFSLSQVKNQDKGTKFNFGKGKSIEEKGYGIGNISLSFDITESDIRLFSDAKSYLESKLTGVNENLRTPECTSGGPGSSSCSIDEVFALACSVTCDPNYYACCQSSTTQCFCVSNPNGDGGGQNGGSNGGGPSGGGGGGCYFIVTVVKDTVFVTIICNEQ